MPVFLLVGGMAVALGVVVYKWQQTKRDVVAKSDGGFGTREQDGRLNMDGPVTTTTREGAQSIMTQAQTAGQPGQGPVSVIIGAPSTPSGRVPQGTVVQGPNAYVSAAPNTRAPVASERVIKQYSDGKAKRK